VRRFERVFAAWSKGGGGLSPFLGFMATPLHSKRNADGLLPIVSISYCWLEAAHPDREGRQLQLLCRKLRSLYGGRGLLGACRDYGFSDMGVFLDWSSGYQKDPALWRGWMADQALYAESDDALSEQQAADRRTYEASRTAEQKAAFDRMLSNTMDLWYAHSAITVVLLTQLPDELPAGFDPSRTYDSRGWTTFERCSAELAKINSLQSARWSLVIDVSDEGGGAERRLPTTPQRMAKLLAGCRFTNGADSSLVLQLYAKTAAAVLGTVRELSYIGLPLVRGDEWTSPTRLAEALNYCERLQELSVCGARLDDEGARELAAGLDHGALPELDILSLSSSRFGARGVAAVCSVFPRGVARRLTLLTLMGTPIGDEGAAALASALETRALPPKLALSVSFCDVGDTGAKAIAAALRRAGPGSRCRVFCYWNRIGLAGRSALLGALEAQHGPAFDHLLAGTQNTWLPGSAAFVRAMARGLRSASESGTAFLPT